MNIKIIVAAHKPYQMPKDGIYMPLHVGHTGKMDIGFQGDDTGENISEKNANFCELTGLYWAWKNLDADYIGLAHYRRHFVKNKHSRDKWGRVAEKSDIEGILQTVDVILPPKRNYFIETTYDQYAHAHHAVDLDTTRDILKENYPEYVPAFERCMKSTSGHKFNMFIMKREQLDSYCRWLFDILFELEKRLDISDYSINDQRVFGFVSERLLDVWIKTNQVEYREMPVLFMEKQNWVVKGGNFLKRKFA